MENERRCHRIGPEIEHAGNGDEVISTVVLRSERHLEPRCHPLENRRAALGRSPLHSGELGSARFSEAVAEIALTRG